jgi:hypothetical protein
MANTLLYCHDVEHRVAHSALLRYGSDFWGSPPHFCSGDLAKRNNNIAVLASYQRLGAFLELSRTFSRKQDELKATGYLIQTVFDGYSSHGKQSSPSGFLTQAKSDFIAYEWSFAAIPEYWCDSRDRLGRSCCCAAVRPA